jgi:hypothetical protein
VESDTFILSGAEISQLCIARQWRATMVLCVEWRRNISLGGYCSEEVPEHAATAHLPVRQRYLEIQRVIEVQCPPLS